MVSFSGKMYSCSLNKIIWFHPKSLLFTNREIASLKIIEWHIIQPYPFHKEAFYWGKKEGKMGSVRTWKPVGPGGPCSPLSPARPCVTKKREPWTPGARATRFLSAWTTQVFIFLCISSNHKFFTLAR